MTVGPVLTHLRAETSALHRALDSQQQLARLLSPRLTRLEYIETLRLLQGITEPLEVFLAEALPELYPPSHPRRARGLAADLDFLGTGVIGEATSGSDGRRSAGLPRGSMPGFLRSLTGGPATALGCAYVWEGSALGGRLIAQRVGVSLGLTPGAGTSYFSSQGVDILLRWQQIVTALEDRCALPAALHAAAAGARAAFGAYIACFESASRPP